MAINAYTGLMGSGKSYSVVENVILPALEKGKRVWTNIPMYEDKISAMDYPGVLTLFETSDIRENEQWFQEVFEPGALIVIDECWRLWPSGMQAHKMIEGHKSFFAEHRHMVGEDGISTEIVLITQDLSQIAATLRNLVEFTYVTTKMNKLGMSKRYRVDIYEKGVSGAKPPKNQLLRQIPGTYKEEVYRFYKSQTMSQAEGHGDEATTDDRSNVFKSGFLRFGVPSFFVLSFLFIWYGYNRVTDAYMDRNQEENLPGGKQLVQVDQVPNKPEKKPNPVLEALLDNADMFISYNAGNWPSIEYRFTILTRESQSVVTLPQLRGLGFHITTVSQCLVLLRNESIITRVQCMPDHQDEEGINPIGDLDLI